MAAGGATQRGWKAGLRALGSLAAAIFLIALFKRWLPSPFAAGVAMFVTQVAFYRVPPRPPGDFAGWLRICLVTSALLGGWVFLLSYTGGADNIPAL